VSTDIDLERLNAWLRSHVPAFTGDITAGKFPGGQSNPTYRVSSNAGNFVLRRKPFGPVLDSAHAIDREFHLLTALAPLGFPVPMPLALCEDPGVIGSAFYLMELVTGVTFWDPRLPDLRAELRKHVYEQTIDTLAALHRIDVAAAGLADFGRAGNFFARQVDRWTRQYRATQTDLVPEVEHLIEWLPRSIPEQARTAIIHGDFRLDNLIFDESTLTVAAVIDWELSTLGDPLADLTYFLMNWVMPVDGQFGLADVDLRGLGLPTLSEVTERYCAAAGLDGLPPLHWYFAFNLFRLTSIVQGVKRRMLDGTASSQEAETVAAKVNPLAKLAWAQAQVAEA
jgi:aminoglycoside phosphotransferase (APT) family kinase protein